MKDTIKNLMALVEEADVVELAEHTMGMVKLDKDGFLRGLRNFFETAPSPYTYVCEWSERTDTKFLFLTADPEYGRAPMFSPADAVMEEEDDAAAAAADAEADEEDWPEDPNPVPEAHCVMVELVERGFDVQDLEVTSPTTGTMRVVDADTGEVVMVRVFHDYYATSTLGQFWSRLNNFVELRDRLTDIFAWHNVGGN